MYNETIRNEFLSKYYIIGLFNENPCRIDTKVIGIQLYSTAHYQINVTSGCFPVPLRFRLNKFFVIASSCFAIFKNVVNSFEPVETPSYSG